MKILLIIPAYNEEANIINTIESINNYKKNMPSSNQLDYIVINDGSTDKTKELLEANQANAVHLIQNLGIGGAVQTGYRYALENDYDIAIQFDGDGQHDVEFVSTIVAPIESKKADFCIGSRFIVKEVSEFQTTTSRRIGIKIISSLIKMVTGNRVYDVTSGFRAANKDIIKEFCQRYPVDFPEPESIVHLYKKKYRIVECPVNMKEREGGQSSIRAFKSVKYMIQVTMAILVSGFMKERD